MFKLHPTGGFSLIFFFCIFSFEICEYDQGSFECENREVAVTVSEIRLEGIPAHIGKGTTLPETDPKGYLEKI